jgi:hypothetical protein
MTRKSQFLDKLIKAFQKGFIKKSPQLITKLELLPEELFEKSLDEALKSREDRLEKKE